MTNGSWTAVARLRSRPQERIEPLTFHFKNKVLTLQGLLLAPEGTTNVNMTAAGPWATTSVRAQKRTTRDVTSFNVHSAHWNPRLLIIHKTISSAHACNMPAYPPVHCQTQLLLFCSRFILWCLNTARKVATEYVLATGIRNRYHNSTRWLSPLTQSDL